jgi:hypothetical protein
MPVIIGKKVPGKADCPHCWAEEGQGTGACQKTESSTEEAEMSFANRLGKPV